MDNLEYRSLHCPLSHLMPSANKLRPLKVHLKGSKTSKLNLRPNHNLELSLPHRMNSLRITQQILNNVMLTIATTSNNMDCSKGLRANKMVPHLNALTADMEVLKPRVQHLNFLRVQLNNPSHVSRLQVKVKPAAILRQTQQPKLNNKELRVRSLSQATHNNLKLPTTHTATLTTLALITLST